MRRVRAARRRRGAQAAVARTARCAAGEAVQRGSVARRRGCHVWGGGRSGRRRRHGRVGAGRAAAGRRAPAVAQRAAGQVGAGSARARPEVAVRWPERRPAGWSSRLLGRGGTAERRPKRLTARPDDGRGGVPGGLAERWPNGSRRHRRGSAEARSAGAVASGTAASVEWRLGRFAGVGIWLGG